MNTVNDFFGASAPNPWRAYLEFGLEETHSEEREVARFLRDQDAYDLWHLAVRYKEVLTCRQLANRDHLQIEDLPRKEKFLIFYLLLAEYSETSSVVELGCSVFELIDGLEVVERYFDTNCGDREGVDVKSLTYDGIDISALLSQAALDLHRDYRVRVSTDTASFLSAIANEDRQPRALFDLGVSGYAFTSSGDLAEFLGLFEVAHIRLALSKDQTFVSTTSSKSLAYFSLPELLEALDKPLFYLCEYGAGDHMCDLRSMGRPSVHGFFVCGERERIERALMQTGVRDVERFFEDMNIGLTEATELLNL